jgi:hypothetical protein
MISADRKAKLSVSAKERQWQGQIAITILQNISERALDPEGRHRQP